MYTQPTDEQPVDFSGRTLGPYRLAMRIGYGGTATVYRAIDRETKAEVAIKVLHKGSDRTTILRFQKEIALARTLCEQYTNRHLAKIVQDGHEDGLHWVAMELMRGKTVREVINTAPKSGMHWEAAAFILLNVCGAVASMHDLEVVHRDIKPENIFLSLTATGQLWVTLLDLGIAKEFSVEPKTQEGMHLTDKNEIPGTGPYMAPERVLGGPCTPATDQYSLGVLLYECLHRQLPYPPSANYTSLRLQVHGSLANLPWKKLPAELKDIVLRAMSKECSERFPSALDMGRALYACLESARDFVDGKAATMELLETPSPNVAPPPQQPSAAPPDETTTNNTALPEQYAARAQRSASFETPKAAVNNIPLGSFREQSRPERQTRPNPPNPPSSATTRPPPPSPHTHPTTAPGRRPAEEREETVDERSKSVLLARHGQRIFRIMRITLTLTMAAIVTMMVLAGDPQWTRLQKLWTQRQDDAGLIEVNIPFQSPKKTPEPEPTPRTREAPEVLAIPPALPPPTTRPDGKRIPAPEIARPPREAPRPTPPSASPPDTKPIDPPPAEAPPDDHDDLLLPIPARPAKGIREFSASDAPKERSEMPVTPVRRTDPQLREQTSKQTSKRIRELCPLDPNSSVEQGEVCVTLVISKQGLPLSGNIDSSRPSDLSFVDKKGVNCVLRVAKANINLKNLASVPDSFGECFTVKR